MYEELLGLLSLAWHAGERNGKGKEEKMQGPHPCVQYVAYAGDPEASMKTNDTILYWLGGQVGKVPR